MFSCSMLAPLLAVAHDLMVVAVGYASGDDIGTIGAVSRCSMFD